MWLLEGLGLASISSENKFVKGVEIDFTLDFYFCVVIVSLLSIGDFLSSLSSIWFSIEFRKESKCKFRL